MRILLKLLPPVEQASRLLPAASNFFTGDFQGESE
jgi:hypothetical protein